MKLFTVGPVQMDPAVLEAGARPLPYFRTAEFSEQMLQMETQFLRLLNAPPESRAVFMTASGTGAMEAAVTSILNPERDKALVIDGGSFGHRFAELCELYHIPYVALELPFAADLTEELLLPYQEAGFTALLMQQSETSLGKRYDMEAAARFCRHEGLYLIVDAVSSFLCDPLDMTACGADVILTASQKALALSPGLSLLALSPRIIAERLTDQPPRCFYLSLSRALENMKRGQTPFTPALSVLQQLAYRLQQLDQLGLQSELKQRESLALYFRQQIRQLPGLLIPDYTLSNSLTPLLTGSMNAYDLFVDLKDHTGLVVTPNGGPFAHKLLRVGHMGDLKKTDYDDLIQALSQRLA
ncbi:alanine--glyoxylate aminotransferase family protein [Oscillospiraceae bacterium HV4-5-C5C]|nr:alanine--glyoxylate aminotransferase family protein [Oscillospiraceae bacterium HV4-5-C5C]